jgi:L-tryptophan---pyruvate aminotransferase
MYEVFWRAVGPRVTTVVPGQQAMSYVSSDDGAGGLCWFLEPALEREARRLHRLVGNAAVDGYHLVVGNGATQLFQAAVYALSVDAPADRMPVPVVCAAPYYSVRARELFFFLKYLYVPARDD